MRVWQSLPHDRVDELARLGLSSGLGDDMLRLGYLKAFMDGTLGSRTARLLDGSGVADHERRRAGRDRHARRARRLAGRRARDRRPRQPRGAGRLRARRATSGSRAACDRGSSTRSCSPRRTSRGSAALGVAASVQFSHAPSDRELADRFWAGMTAPRLRVPVALGLRRARGQRLGRADRGARPAGRYPRRCPPRLASRAGGHARRGARGHVRQPGDPLRRRAPPRQAPARATWPISSSSTATPTTTRGAQVQVVATMLGGRWTFNPPPWD